MTVLAVSKVSKQSIVDSVLAANGSFVGLVEKRTYYDLLRIDDVAFRPHHIYSM